MLLLIQLHVRVVMEILRLNEWLSGHIFPPFSASCLCPPDPTFVWHHNHFWIMVWNIQMFVWVGAVLGFLGNFTMLNLWKPFFLIVTSWHDHMLHVLHVCLLIHQSLEPLRYFINSLQLNLLARVYRDFLLSTLDGRRIVNWRLLRVVILRNSRVIGAIEVNLLLLQTLDHRLFVLYVQVLHHIFHHSLIL